MTIRQALRELGLYTEPPRGRPALYSHDEKKRVKAEQSRAARARAVADRATTKAGDAPPKRKLGRPKLYNTSQEAKAAQLAQNRVCMRRYNERMIEALRALKDTLEPTSQVEPSPDEQNILQPI